MLTMSKPTAFKPTALSLAFPLILLLLALPAAADQQRPNVVVFLIDDMGVMDTSVPFLTDDQGQPKRYPLNRYYRTPNMEQLASRGIRFNNFYAMSVCSPTRVSIMTGQNAARHGTTNWINPTRNNGGPLGPEHWNWEGLSSEDVTLASLLQAAGYRTIHIGKGHFAPRGTSGADPANLGFDANVGGASFGAPGSYYAQLHYGRKTRRASHAVPDLEAYHGSDTYLTEALTQEAKSLVADAVADDQPFYLYFSHYAVHAPFESDPRFAQHYDNADKPELAKAFATMIEGIDKSLGDIMDHLRELDVADDTIIFFLGDNGSDAPLGHPHEVACAAPLRGKKGSHYEGGMRVPFIAAWGADNPDNTYQQQLPIAVGAIQSQLAAVHDLFPTILSLANVASPTGHVVDGIDLATLLAGKPDSSRRQTFLMHYPHAPHRSDYFTCYRDGQWKVIYHYLPFEAAGDSHYELFDLSADPFESHNLATTNPEQLDVMMEKLITSLEAHGALYPEQNGQPLIPQVGH